MRRDQAVQNMAPVGQIPTRSDLIRIHQAAIAFDVGRENRHKPALDISHLEPALDCAYRLSRVQRAEHLKFRLRIPFWKKAWMSVPGSKAKQKDSRRDDHSPTVCNFETVEAKQCGSPGIGTDPTLKGRQRDDCQTTESAKVDRRYRGSLCVA